MKKNKKVLSVLLSLLMVLSAVSALGTVASAANSLAPIGECGAEGNNLTWDFSNGTLTISGTGEMRDYVGRQTAAPGEVSPFDRNYSIKNLVISEGVTRIGNLAFPELQELENVTLPSTLRSIGNSAFSGSLMPAIILPEGLETIGANAFGYCESLEKIRVPASVTYIGAGALTNGNGVKAVTVDAENPAYTAVDGVLFTKDMKKLCGYPISKKADQYYIPDGVEIIEKNAFSWPCAITLFIPLSVTEIGSFALWSDALKDIYYAGSEDQWNALIGGDPYIYDASSQTVHFDADGIPFPPAILFSGSCGENTFWAFDEDTKTLTVSGTGATFDYTDAADCPFRQHYYLVKHVVIEDGVTAIGSHLFESLFEMNDVEIPASVKQIGDCAFRYCSALPLDAIPDSIESIGTNAFAGCGKIQTVILPASLTELGAQAFDRDTVLLYTGTQAQWNALTADLDGAENLIVVCGYVPGTPVPTVVINSGACGDGVTWTLWSNGTLEISGEGTMADYNCSYDIDEGEYISDQPYFRYRKRTNRIVVRSGITGVGRDAFWFMTAEEIVIEEGVETIGRAAFGYINPLNVYLPVSLKSVGNILFYDSRVRDVWYAGTEEQWKTLTKGIYLTGGEWYEDLEIAPPTIHFGTESIPEEPADEPEEQTNGFVRFFRQIADFFQRILDFFKKLFGKK